MLTNHIQSYMESVQYYMSLVTDHAQFDFAKMLSQLAASVKREGKVPHFMPYLDKTQSKKTKAIIAASRSGQKGEFSDADLAMSNIFIFDQVIRKAVTIAEKESVEKVKASQVADAAFEDPEEAAKAKERAFDDIDKIWFFVLNSLFKIKDEQTRVLEKLILQKKEGI